jgi:uncharacterized protein (UPF0179 family)
MSNIGLMPDISVPEKDKTDEWCKGFLNYARYLLQTYDWRKQDMTALYQSYNGVKTQKQNDIWQKTYGKSNKAKYVAYRAGRTKINLLHGEWIKRPLAATVETINIEAISEKMRQMDFMTGAMMAKGVLEELRDKAGVDIMNGAEIPSSEEDPLWEKYSPKDKCEDIMQLIINEQIKSLNLVQKFGEQFLDVCVTSSCYGKLEINEKGDVDWIKIDPRDAIYQEIENDYFLEKSPIKGARQRLPIYALLQRYDFTEAEKNTLKEMQNDWVNSWSSNRWMGTMNGKELLVDVIHVEWKAMKPRYYKVAPKTSNQLEWDSSEPNVTFELDAKHYENNKAVFDKEVEVGKYVVETKWEEDLWEGTMIGGVIFKNMRRKPFQMRRHDAPAYILDSSYLGINVGTVDGLRISVQKVIENFDNIFDIIMYQILKELAKMKGKVMMYDRAALPKKRTLKDIAYDMTNDSFIDVDSSASGNFANRNLSGMELFKEFDLGLSASVQQLLVLKDQVLQTMDRLTGINETREGAIQASATVTNSQQSIENSRTQTAPVYYAMELFTERVLTLIAEATKVSYAFYKQEKGEQILGSGKFKYMQMSQDVGFKDYGVHLQSGGRYNEIKQRMRQLMEFSLNSKQIEPVDVLKFEMSETFVEAKQIFEDAYVRVQKIASEQRASDAQTQMQLQQQQLQQQLEIANGTREDIQKAEIDKVVAETEGQILIDKEKSKNKMVNDQHQAENKFLQE